MMVRSMERAPRLPGADGFRAFAMVIVCLGHYDMAWPKTHAWGSVALNEGLGPVLFFVLSGALLMRSLLVDFEQSGTIDLPRFFRRRALRFLPAYVGFLLFDLIVSDLRGNPWPLSSIVAAAAIAPNVYSMFAEPSASNPTASLWSIGVAVQLLLVLVPIIRWMLTQYGLATVRILLIAIALGSAGFRVAADGQQSLDYIYNSPLLRADGLALGMLTGTFLPRTLLHDGSTAAPSIRIPGIVATVCFVLVVAGVVIPLSRSTMLFWVSFPWALCASAIVLAVLSSSAGWLRRLFDGRLPTWLGQIAYSVLLVQWYAISLDRRLGVVPWPLRMVPVIAAAIAAGWVLHRLLEAPFVRRLEQSTA